MASPEFEDEQQSESRRTRLVNESGLLVVIDAFDSTKLPFDGVNGAELRRLILAADGIEEESLKDAVHAKTLWGLGFLSNEEAVIDPSLRVEAKRVEEGASIEVWSGEDLIRAVALGKKSKQGRLREEVYGKVDEEMLLFKPREISDFYYFQLGGDEWVYKVSEGDWGRVEEIYKRGDEYLEGVKFAAGSEALVVSEVVEVGEWYGLEEKSYRLDSVEGWKVFSRQVSCINDPGDVVKLLWMEGGLFQSVRTDIDGVTGKVRLGQARCVIEDDPSAWKVDGLIRVADQLCKGRGVGTPVRGLVYVEVEDQDAFVGQGSGFKASVRGHEYLGEVDSPRFKTEDSLWVLAFDDERRKKLWARFVPEDGAVWFVEGVEGNQFNRIEVDGEWLYESAKWN